jgi:hypothetical protein
MRPFFGICIITKHSCIKVRHKGVFMLTQFFNFIDELSLAFGYFPDFSIQMAFASIVILLSIIMVMTSYLMIINKKNS